MFPCPPWSAVRTAGHWRLGGPAGAFHSGGFGGGDDRHRVGGMAAQLLRDFRGQLLRMGPWLQWAAGLRGQLRQVCVRVRQVLYMYQTCVRVCPPDGSMAAMGSWVMEAAQTGVRMCQTGVQVCQTCVVYVSDLCACVSTR